MKKAFSRSLSCLLSVVMLFGIFVITDVEINATAYNAQAAVNYAKKYWSNYNPDYPNCNSIGGDCANFVSQCLYAGGLQQDSEWKVGSAAWQACPSMYNYFDRKGYTIIDYASASDIKLGNPVLYWNADKGRWSHAAICTGFNGSTPLVSAHNNDRCDVDWKLGGSAYWGSDRRATILINDGSVPYIDIGTNFYAYIINNGAWKMATVKSDDVKLYPETAFRDQIWYFERQDDKSYKITNIQTGKCLDVQDGGNSDGSNVLAWNSNDGNNQRWYFSGVQGDCYIIPKNAPSKALDLAGGATGDGTNIQIWTQNGTAAQKFHIWKFDNKPNKPTVTSSSDKYAVGSNVKVSWGENAFATSYWVDVWHNNQHTESFGINDTSYTVKNVTAGEYTVFVASCNPNGASETGAFTFNVPTYTISYNMNGGSGSIGNQTKIYGQDLTLSSTKPTRTGYDFLGWNTNKDATTAQYSAGGKYTANSGATLYAIWKINTWTVSYNMNGGSGSIGNQTKTYNQDLTLSSTKPTRTGYDFVGWNTNASATTAQYSAGGKYTANSGATLYAIWKINTWTVSYNMNGGSGSIGNQTKTYGQDLTLSSTKPTRTGYDFVGWNTNASATTAQYSAGGKYTANSGATLYAIWKKIDENLGTYKYANPNKTTLYARISYNGTDKYLTNLSDNASNDKSYKNVQLKTKNDTLQQVWEFEKLSDGGYKISSIYDGRILDIYNTKTDNGTNIGACGTYYANGGQIWYLIKKDGKYVIQPKVSTGVYLGVANTNDGGNVQVTTSSHLFNIEILKPVGTSTMKAVQEGTSTSPTKFTWTAATDATWYNLYIYDGEVWKSNCIYGQKNIKGLEWSVQLKPGTYQAHLSPVNIHNWTNSNVVSFTVKADTYTISYNMNGGSGSIANQTKTYGQDLTLSSTKPTRTGYDFVGWNTNKDATTAQYSAGGKYTANSGATLYAIWKIQAPSAKPVIANLNETYNAGQNLTITWNKIDRASSYWVNIWRNPGGESTKIVNTSITANSYTLSKLTPGKYGIIIDAKNESGYTTSELYNFYVPFTIKYDMNSGTGTISPTYKKLDIECTLSGTVPTKTDYKFIGWNTDKNATTAQYQAGSKYTANGDITLYAIWAINHDYIAKVVAPTCTEKGYTLHTCKNCNDSYKDTYTNALGHDYKLTSEKVATCTTDGEKIYTCSRCGDTKTETVKATGHSYTTKVIAPTCTEKGYTLHTCSKCGDSYKDTYTNATGHKYEETIVAPTTTEQGYTLHTCSVCKHSYKDNYTNILLSNNSTLSAETIKLGETVTATANATGGTGEYLYQVVYKQITQSKWTTAQSYKANATVTFKPANAVTYDVCVKVKDSNNTEVKKFFTVKVTSDELKNVSTISAQTINLGSTVTVNAKATGSTGFYTYAVYYKQKAQTKWTTKQDFKANNTIAVKPAKATTYDICVKVKDDKGTIVKKYFTVNVTDFTNTSTLSATEIKLGNTVKVSCSATGSTGYYQYAVYYKKTSDTKWTTKQSYSSNNTVTIKPAKATTYDVCVKVKDNQNNEVKKYFKVTVQ